MAIVGDLSGSQANNHVIGMTGSVVIGRPFGDTGLASNLPGLPGNDVVLFVSGNIDLADLIHKFNTTTEALLEELQT